jgi:hypothetical protein
MHTLSTYEPPLQLLAPATISAPRTTGGRYPLCAAPSDSRSSSTNRGRPHQQRTPSANRARPTRRRLSDDPNPHNH